MRVGEFWGGCNFLELFLRWNSTAGATARTIYYIIGLHWDRNQTRKIVTSFR